MTCTELLEALQAAILADKEWGEAERLWKARREIAEDHFAACVKALEETLPRCNDGDCEELGVWEWSDEDGNEFNCDQHKNRHFYAHGPSLKDDLVAARDALADLRRALEAALPKGLRCDNCGRPPPEGLISVPGGFEDDTCGWCHHQGRYRKAAPEAAMEVK